jgi:hypothetical protein
MKTRHKRRSEFTPAKAGVQGRHSIFGGIQVHAEPSTGPPFALFACFAVSHPLLRQVPFCQTNPTSGAGYRWQVRQPGLGTFSLPRFLFPAPLFHGQPPVASTRPFCRTNPTSRAGYWWQVDGRQGVASFQPGTLNLQPLLFPGRLFRGQPSVAPTMRFCRTNPTHPRPSASGLHVKSTPRESAKDSKTKTYCKNRLCVRCRFRGSCKLTTKRWFCQTNPNPRRAFAQRASLPGYNPAGRSPGSKFNVRSSRFNVPVF